MCSLSLLRCILWRLRDSLGKNILTLQTNYLNMKKLFLIFFLLAMPLVTMLAQSAMTDKQVMEFVMEEREKGTSNEVILNKLLKRGVSKEQLQRIKNKHDAQQMGKDESKVTNVSRLRKSTDKAKERKTKDGKKELKRRVGSDSRTETSRFEDRRLNAEPVYDDSDFLPDSLVYDEIYEEEVPAKRIFGHDIFNNNKLNFEPDMNIATPEDYVLGPGDVVFIDIWGASQKSINGTISPEGDVDIEGVGPLSIAGLTVKQANRKLKSTVGNYYKDSNVRMSVGQTKSITINVMGEVKMPGTYSLSAFATVFHALYMAGGVNEIGTLRDVRVYRDNKLMTRVDLYDYILNGKMQGNIRLASGDVVIVGPYLNLVNIAGKVKRPMYYEMKDKESVATLLGYAGGFSGDAYQNTLRLIRKKGGLMSVYSIDEFERTTFKVSDGDSIFVDSVLDRYTNMVEVRGAVYRPGKYQMDGDITTVRQLLELAGGLKAEAFANRVIMHRRKEDRTLEVLSFDGSAMVNRQIPDITLRNEDVVFVPSREEVIGKRTLSIDGEVMHPGIYDYADNTTLEDLILQAGGLTDAASVVKVDVARRIVDNKALRSDTVLARDFSFALKGGFVVDGQPGFVLMPFDEIYVRRSPGYVEQSHVTVVGEVAFDGDYVITRKSQRLSDLIQDAGGLTAEAYPEGARLERVLTPEEKLRQQTLLKLATNGDSVSLKKLDLGDTRFVGINLDMALKNPGNPEWDILLQKGDKLIIPKFNNTVSISGEVMYPNTVIYKDNKKLSYYINQAGGYNTNARKNRVFAVNMNGTVTRIKGPEDIQPGCEIVIPSKSKRRKMTVSEIIGMGSMTASIAAIIATLIKN